MLMRRADLFIVYCVTLLPELNVTEDATNGLRLERGGRSGVPPPDISQAVFPTMGHISNLSAHKEFITGGQMRYIEKIFHIFQKYFRNSTNLSRSNLQLDLHLTSNSS